MQDFGDFFKNKTILVTGGAGAIGGRLARRLNDLGAKRIIILDNLSSSYEWNIASGDRIQFIQDDILDEEKLRWTFKNKPDIVYHLAAHFANQNSVDNPETDLMVNGIGILKVLQYAQMVGVERFVYSSSGCGVYSLESDMIAHFAACHLRILEVPISCRYDVPNKHKKNPVLHGLEIVNAMFHAILNRQRHTLRIVGIPLVLTGSMFGLVPALVLPPGSGAWTYESVAAFGVVAIVGLILIAGSRLPPVQTRAASHPLTPKGSLLSERLPDIGGDD